MPRLEESLLLVQLQFQLAGRTKSTIILSEVSREIKHSLLLDTKKL